MSKNCDKSPCNKQGCKCDEKKEQFEKCCPKSVRCMSPTEYDGLVSDYETSVLSDAAISSGRKQYDKHSQDPDFVDLLIQDQYQESDSGVSRGECQQKSKCQLRKYKDQDEECCPGQTGHHIIPGSAFSPCKERTKTDCYSSGHHNNALVVCVAGSSHSVGTHGMMHKATQEEFNRIADAAGKEEVTMNYGQTKSASMKAFQKVFKNSSCDLKCMKRDLDKNYKEMDEVNNADKRKDRQGNPCPNISDRKFSTKKYGCAAEDTAPLDYATEYIQNLPKVSR